MDALEAISSRRSIRKYKADPVDDKTLEIILDAARLAPSWANTQCWRFIVVRNKETQSKLADTIRPNPNLGVNPSLNAIRNAPVVIVACAKKEESGFFNGKTATDKGEYWFMFDVALAMENLMIAANALGLGTVQVGLFNTPEVTEIMGVPDDHHVVEMCALGYPEKQPGPRPRKELEEIVYYEKFGQK
jgi:nitroreductase